MVWDIDPVIVNLGFIELRYYGVLFASGIFTAYFIASKLMKERELPEKHLDSILIYVVIGVIIGAHLVHLIFYEPESFINNPIRIIEIGKGLASHGGLLGAVIGMLLFCRKYKVNFFEYSDPLAVGATLTSSFVRMGNFFNSEILGRVVDPEKIPWAVKFARIDNQWRHPSQIYEVLMGLLIFAIIYPLYKKTWRQRRPGFFLFLFLVMYFSLRFLVEFVKRHQSRIIVEGSQFDQVKEMLTMGQWLSLPIVLFALYMLFGKPGFARKRKEESS